MVNLIHIWGLGFDLLGHREGLFRPSTRLTKSAEELLDQTVERNSRLKPEKSLVATFIASFRPKPLTDQQRRRANEICAAFEKEFLQKMAEYRRGGDAPY